VYLALRYWNLKVITNFVRMLLERNAIATEREIILKYVICLKKLTATK